MSKTQRKAPEEASKRYQSFWKEKKKKCKKRLETYIKIFLKNKKKQKKHQFHRERNNNLSEEEKGKTVEYEMFLFST